MLPLCLNLDGRIFPQHVCKNAQLSAKKHTKARSHCLFARVDSQKTRTHGNLAWQPVLVRCVSPTMTIHHLTLFVRLLLFLPVFLRCIFSKVTRLLAVDAMCFSQTWSVRSTVSIRVRFKEFPLEPNNEFKREITAQLVKFCEKQPDSIDLWLRREPPLLAHFCVSHHSTDLKNRSRSKRALRNEP